MKDLFLLLILSFLSYQCSFSQNSLLDSIIAVQADSLLQIKLLKFKAGGIEKVLVTNSLKANDFVDAAMKYIGTPHCMGGNGKTTKNSKDRKCIDCSGLLYATFSDLGINTGVHNSQEMARYGKIIADTAQIQKGDILFFVRSYNSSNPEIVITHSAISLGNGKMIHASASKGVEVIPISTSYWATRFIFATKVF
jgi:murein DD-endopeptidase / murein LD-carboxypeptidase